MAGASVTAARKATALRMLQEGFGTTAIVTELAASQGISRRQARRLVAAAHAEVVADLSDVNAAEVLAAIVHRLEEVGRVAMERNQPAAAVAAYRLLADLVVTPHRSRPTGQFGRFGRSSWG